MPGSVCRHLKIAGRMEERRQVFLDASVRNPYFKYSAALQFQKRPSVRPQISEPAVARTMRYPFHFEVPCLRHQNVLLSVIQRDPMHRFVSQFCVPRVCRNGHGRVIESGILAKRVPNNLAMTYP
jgi:hypothetical protein